MTTEEKKLVDELSSELAKSFSTAFNTLKSVGVEYSKKNKDPKPEDTLNFALPIASEEFGKISTKAIINFLDGLKLTKLNNPT